MGHHCCSKQKVKRGLWSPEEDEKLIKCITSHGHGCWSAVPKLAGLQRCGKSCRLRWINYLRPDLKRGSFSSQEERIIIDCHRILGNRWAQIAKHLPGRTDNEVKNFWNSCIKKKLIAQGLDPKTHNLLPSHQIHNNIKNACNVNQFYQQPSSVFSINTQIRSDASMDMNQSFITLLPPHASSTIHPPLPQASMSISTLDYQNQNHVWPAANDQNSPASTYFANQSSITPLSSTSMNPPGLGFLDHENCLWSDGGIESMVTPTEEEMNTAGQVMQQDKLVGDQVELEARDNGQDMDTSFSECSNFDLEFMESPLISCGLMYNNMNSMDHQLSWDS